MMIENGESERSSKISDEGGEIRKIQTPNRNTHIEYKIQGTLMFMCWAMKMLVVSTGMTFPTGERSLRHRKK